MFCTVYSCILVHVFELVDASVAPMSEKQPQSERLVAQNPCTQCVTRVQGLLSIPSSYKLHERIHQQLLLSLCLCLCLCVCDIAE